MNDLSGFEEKIGVKFSDQSLLRQALTHRSYINEHRDMGLSHNERLEFLGDAVLELVTTEYLFSKYPDKTEGDMTAYRAALVNTTTLSAASMRLEVGDYLLLSRGEEKGTERARQYILTNAYEAIIGAIYLDKGYEGAKKFIEKNLLYLTDEIVEKGLWQDAKSRFQEMAQEKFSETPAYKTLKEEGPDHDKHFTVGVFIGGEEVASGEGKSKQEAEQEAAREGLKEKGWE